MGGPGGGCGERCEKMAPRATGPDEPTDERCLCRHRVHYEQVPHSNAAGTDAGGAWDACGQRWVLACVCGSGRWRADYARIVWPQRAAPDYGAGVMADPLVGARYVDVCSVVVLFARDRFVAVLREPF